MAVEHMRTRWTTPGDGRSDHARGTCAVNLLLLLLASQPQESVTLQFELHHARGAPCFVAPALDSGKFLHSSARGRFLPNECGWGKPALAATAKAPRQAATLLCGARAGLAKPIMLVASVSCAALPIHVRP
eukprot:2652274-Rhodomonas_salina.2